MSDRNGATSVKLARWQGKMEQSVRGVRNDLEERDKRYTERAEAQDKAVMAALAAQKEAVAAALAAADKAVDKAETTAEKWRQNANEWRGAMSDRDRELPSRREMEQAFAAMDSRLKHLESDAERRRGGEGAVESREGKREVIRGDLIALVGVFVGLAFVVVALLHH